MGCKCSASHNRREYNGWTNYETWLSNNHIQNSETWLGHLEEELRACFRDASGDDLQEWRDDAIDSFRALLERDVKGEDQEDVLLPNGLWADLLESAFLEVCWDELAEGFASEWTSENELYELADELGVADCISGLDAYREYLAACDAATEFGMVEIFPIEAWRDHGQIAGPYRIIDGIPVAGMELPTE